MSESETFLHDDLVTLTAWMADNGSSPTEIAYAVEKPWKFADELRRAKCTVCHGTGLLIDPDTDEWFPDEPCGYCGTLDGDPTFDDDDEPPVQRCHHGYTADEFCAQCRDIVLSRAAARAFPERYRT